MVTMLMAMLIKMVIVLRVVLPATSMSVRRWRDPLGGEQAAA